MEDLFQLPASIHVVQLAQRMQQAIAQTSTLFWALHKAHGVEFYSIGILRFVSDVSGFAGPLLLGGLLSYTTAADMTAESGSSFDAGPYWYAFGLFATTLICAYSIFFSHLYTYIHVCIYTEYYFSCPSVDTF